MSARLPLGKEPETEGKIFCRPGGVASPRFGWPPAKRTGRSQEVEWTKSGRRIQRRRNGTDRIGAEKGARVCNYLSYKPYRTDTDRTRCSTRPGPDHTESIKKTGP
ncbi:uncharacterized [Tachysurus ichikawai]